jgi:hypothetical protein
MLLKLFVVKTCVIGLSVDIHLCIFLTLPFSDFTVRPEPAEEGACAF